MSKEIEEKIIEIELIQKEINFLRNKEMEETMLALQPYIGKIFYLQTETYEAFYFPKSICLDDLLGECFYFQDGLFTWLEEDIISYENIKQYRRITSEEFITMALDRIEQFKEILIKVYANKWE